MVSAPYAILPSMLKGANINSDHRILSFSEKKKMKRNQCSKMLKGFADAWCVGYSHGWPFLLDHEALPLLLNPSSRASLPSPPFPPKFTHIGLLLSHSYFVQVCLKSFVAKFVLNYNNSDANYALASYMAPLSDPDANYSSYCLQQKPQLPFLLWHKMALFKDGTFHSTDRFPQRSTTLDQPWSCWNKPNNFQ